MPFMKMLKSLPTTVIAQIGVTSGYSPLVDNHNANQDITKEERNKRVQEFWNKLTNGDKAKAGKLYEQYVGYMYEKAGYYVEYNGILKQNQDMGRDLICQRGHRTIIIQCKYSQSPKGIVKVACVHQLFGSYWQYALEHPSELVRGVLYTPANVEGSAKEAACKLGIILKYQHKLDIFPRIKCIHKKRIYYVPDDMIYDRIAINLEAGDIYCYTEKSAREKGYRKA